MLSRLDPLARRFLARLPVAAAAALALWFALLSAPWGHAVATVAEAAIRLAERPAVTFVSFEEGSFAFRRSDFSTRSDTPALEAAPLTANLVLLLALALATPGVGSARSLLRLLLSAGALLLAQALHLVLAVETTYATDLGAWSLYAYPRWQREVLATGRYFFDIALKYALPFVLWGVFVALPRLREREAQASRDAAEPRTRPHRKRRAR